MNDFEQLKNKYEVTIEEKSKETFFKILDKKGKIIGSATIELKRDKDKGRDNEKWYSLKNINSFTDKSSGVATSILQKINEFLQRENAIATGIVWDRELLGLFERNGWVAVEKGGEQYNKIDNNKVAIFYNSIK